MDRGEGAKEARHKARNYILKVGGGREEEIRGGEKHPRNFKGGAASGAQEKSKRIKEGSVCGAKVSGQLRNNKQERKRKSFTVLSDRIKVYRKGENQPAPTPEGGGTRSLRPVRAHLLEEEWQSKGGKQNRAQEMDSGQGKKKKSEGWGTRIDGGHHMFLGENP